jgi:uracil-DNA glycosylase family protein
MPTTHAKVELSALPFLPERISLPSLKEAARHCQGCPLYLHATQTVFGEGKRSARVFMIGEQPGHDEDEAGKPFVGPSGRLLNEALEAAQIDRQDAYVTNVVKHFKFVMKGKRQMHKSPSAREIAACLPWLEKELEVVKPEVLVCLGATASKAILGRDFRVSVQHGQVIPTQFADQAVATVHPSSILRQPTSEDRRRAMAGFIEDLRVVAGLLAQA